jgi:hypothetical protein
MCRSTAARSDRPAAPPTGRGGGPPFWTVHVCSDRVRARLGSRPLGQLTPVPLAILQSGSVSGATADSHADDAPDESPETRHHALAAPRSRGVWHMILLCLQ